MTSRKIETVWKYNTMVVKCIETVYEKILIKNEMVFEKKQNLFKITIRQLKKIIKVFDKWKRSSLSSFVIINSV